MSFDGLIFPPGKDCCFAIIVEPKTGSRGGGHEQHVRIVPRVICRFLRWLQLSPFSDGLVWERKITDFRKEWDRALQAFGVSPRTADGYTPASLRAGAASAMYVDGQPLDAIRWVLRHKDQQSLNNYIQELPAAMARAKLAPGAWSKLLRFSAKLEDAVEERCGALLHQFDA